MISISRAGSMRSPVIVVGRFALKFARNARGSRQQSVRSETLSKCERHATMSAVRYGLTMLAGAGTTYDPHQKKRELVQVTVTRRRLSGNQSRWYQFPWGLPGRARP